jgi:hypothetical protein
MNRLRAGSKAIASALMASCSKVENPGGLNHGNDPRPAMDYDARLL